MFSQPRTFQRNARYERWRWRIFIITWLSYGSFYFTRKGFSVAKVELLKPEIMGMSKIELSWIDGAYLVSYAIGQFVWGMCGDRFGTRRVIQAGMMASILVAFAMGASTTAWMFGTLFCIQGMCQSSGWAPLNKNMGEFFSRRERGRVMGFWCTNYPLFGFLASVLAGWSISYYGSWPYAFWIPASILFLVWILFLLLQRNRPEDIGLPSIESYHGEDAILEEREVTTQKTHEAVAGTWKIIQEVFANRIVWLLGAVYFLLKPTRYLVLFWSPVYIHERLNTSAFESGTISAIFDLAGPLGAITGGFVSDLLFRSKRIPVSIIGLVGVAAVLFCVPYFPDTSFAMGICFFLIGFLLFIPDSLVCSTAAIDFGTKQSTSTAVGLINGFGSIGAILGGILPGLLEKILGEETYIWGYVFYGLGISLLVAVVILIPHWNRLPSSR